MNADNSVILNRLFTRSTLLNILSGESSSTYEAVVRQYIDNPEQKTHGQILQEIYHILQTEYRNEYYYKNTLLNKLLLGVHSPKTTTALTEIPVAKSKADFILINGKAVVYEIKSDLDNFDRLERQLADYYKAFSRVAVISCEGNFNQLCRLLEGTPTGIYVLNNQGNISKSQRKEPEEYTDALSHDVIFKIMTKPEYETLLLKYFKCLPNVSQFEYYRTCKEKFRTIDIGEAYRSFIAILKKRYHVTSQYDNVPYELKFLAYFMKLRNQDYSQLQKFLNETEDKLCTSPI